MGPLGMSAKQHREYLKLQSQEQREQAKMEREESRKNQLHEIKLNEAAAKANQGIGHKEDLHAVKLKELGSPLGKPPKINKQKLGIPTQNPMADTGMFKQGQHKLYAQGTEGTRGTTDTVPAMLTPGEAVIPAPAAQNPKNKKAIKRMVQEGRQANKLRDGAVNVVNSDTKQYAQGTMQVPSLAYEHPDVPGSSFEDGTERVYDFNRGSAAQANYADGTYGVVPQQVQSAAGYFNGTIGASDEDRLNNATNSLGVDLNRDEPVYPEVQVVEAPTPIGRFFSSVGDTIRKWDQESVAAGQAYKQQEDLRNKVQETYGPKAAVPGLFMSQTDAERQKAIDITSKIPTMNTSELQEALKVPKVTASNEPAKPVAPTTVAPISYTTVPKEDGGVQGTYAPLTQSSPTIAERHNNPGNLVFVNQPGAVKGEAKAGGGYWARFETPEAGRTALENQLSLDTQKRGMTLEQTMKKYAPSSDNNNTSAYINTVAKSLGIKPTDKVPAELIPKFADTITTVESGGRYKDPRILNKMTSVSPDAVPQMTALQEPSVEGTGFKEGDVSKLGLQAGDTSKEGFNPENLNRFNALGVSAQANLPAVDAAVQKALSLPQPEQKPFLEKAIGSIFGESGLFNNQELLRFAIVAAGGMLTGARSGRAIQYAARDVLKASDTRHQQQAVLASEERKYNRTRADLLADKRDAAAAESLKDERERYQSDETALTKAFSDSEIPTPYRDQARAIWAKESPNLKTANERAALARHLTQQINVYAVKKDPAASKVNEDQHFYNGKYYTGRVVGTDTDNMQLYDDVSGKWFKPTYRPTPLKIQEAIDRDVEKDATVMALPVLQEKLRALRGKNYSESEAKALAERSSRDAVVAMRNMGVMDSKQANQILRTAFQYQADSKTDINQLPALIEASALYTLSATNRELFASKEGKLPSAENLTQLSFVLDSRVNNQLSGGAKVKAKSELIKDYSDKWKSPEYKAIRKFYEDSYGAKESSFIKWIADGGKQKP